MGTQADEQADYHAEMRLETAATDAGDRTSCPRCGHRLSGLTRLVCPQCNAGLFLKRIDPTESRWRRPLRDAPPIRPEVIFQCDVLCTVCGYNLRALPDLCCRECGTRYTFVPYTLHLPPRPGHPLPTGPLIWNVLRHPAKFWARQVVFKVRPDALRLQDRGIQEALKQVPVRKE